MVRESAWHSARRSAVRLVLTAVGIALVGVVPIAVSGWLVDGVEQTNGDPQTAARRSALGDYFGAAGAVFS